MTESDYLGLPAQTQRFVERLQQLGFDRDRVFGFFTLIGLYAGAPNTQDKLRELFASLEALLPIDRSKNLDEVVGDDVLRYRVSVSLNGVCFFWIEPVRVGVGGEYSGGGLLGGMGIKTLAHHSV